MRPYYRACKLLCRLGFLSLARGRVFGREHVPQRGAALLVCNHQSFFDPVLAGLGLNRECHFMARDSLFRSTPFKRLIESLNAFPVKRGEADVGAIKETLRRLKRGEIVTVFPEGTRTPDGRVRTMHSGVVLLARKAKVPLVPTLILGAYEAWPRQRKLPRPAPVLVAYDRAVTPEQIEALSPEEAIEVVRERIVKLMGRYRCHPTVAAHLTPLRSSRS